MENIPFRTKTPETTLQNLGIKPVILLLRNDGCKRTSTGVRAVKVRLRTAGTISLTGTHFSTKRGAFRGVYRHHHRRHCGAPAVPDRGQPGDH